MSSRHTSHRGLIALLTLLGLLTVAGCRAKTTVPSPPEPGNTQTSARTGTKVNEVKIAQLAESSSLNPLLAREVVAQHRAQYMFERLVKRDAKTAEPRPGLAERWEISPDGLVYTFHIRKGVKWHDGKPVTAHDVVFSIQETQRPDYTGVLAVNWRGLKGAAAFTHGEAKEIEGLKLVNDDTFTVTLDKPNAAFLVVSAESLFPVPKHLLEGQDMKNAPFNKAPVGNGPFKFKEWVSGSHLTVEANPDYWQGKPKIDRIVDRVIPDMTSLMVATETGEIDGTIYLPATEINRLRAMSAVEVVLLPALYNEGLDFNTRHPILGKKEVRQAIAHAIDLNQITGDMLKGVSEPSAAPAPKFSWAYDKEISLIKYDPERAKQLLTQAGYPNGFDIRITANQGNVFRETLATIAQADLAKVGIKVTIDIREWNTVLKEYQEGNFEIQAITNAGWFEPDSMWNAYHSQSPSNYRGFKSTSVDQLLDQARVLVDQEKRKNLYFQAEKILVDELPSLPGFERPNLAVLNKRIKAPALTDPFDPFRDIRSWEVK